MAFAETHSHHHERAAHAERREGILDAFERCNVRTGFHRTTMQDVAREAGMSVGNLYRYFDSKDALVSGLIERDRERLRADFETASGVPDFVAALQQIGRKHFVEEPRERSMQLIEIWAEATRNPKIAAMCIGIESYCATQLETLIDRAKERGEIAPKVDSRTIALIALTLSDGMFRRRAVESDYDAEEGYRLVFSILDGLMRGTIALENPPTSKTTNDF